MAVFEFRKVGLMPTFSNAPFDAPSQGRKRHRNCCNRNDTKCCQGQKDPDDTDVHYDSPPRTLVVFAPEDAVAQVKRAKASASKLALSIPVFGESITK